MKIVIVGALTVTLPFVLALGGPARHPKLLAHQSSTDSREGRASQQLSKQFEVLVELHLDKSMFAEDQPITGSFKFKVGKNTPDLPDPKTVVLNGPQFACLLDGSPLPPHLSFVTDAAIPPSIEVNKLYKGSFRIELDSRISQILSAVKKPLPLVATGAHKVIVSINSQPMFKPLNPDSTFYGNFSSAPEDFITTAPSSGALSAGDLIDQMGSASPFFRGEIAEYYASLKFPLGQLTIFAPPAGRTSLDHTQPPIFVLLKPSEEWQVICTPPSDPVRPNCIVRLGGELRPALPPSTDLSLSAPADEGIYRVRCTQHVKQPWGWILVRKP
jgi:hypothetical protein